MSVPSVGGSPYAMVIVDDFSQYEVVKILKNKNDAARAFQSYMAYYIKP